MRRLTRPLETAERGVALLTDDGVRLSAHHDAPRPGAASPDLAVVVAHGFTLSWSNPAARTLAAELTERAGVVAFDFRGHGRSAGVSTVGDLEVLDLDAALRYARWLGYSRVVTLGFSMGAAVVVRQAGLAGLGRTPHRPDAVAAVSGPSRWNFRGTALMRRVHTGIGTRAGRTIVRHVYGTRVARLGWEPWPEPPDALAAAVSPTPLLVVHGDADPYFPPDHAQWLYDAAREPKQLWLEPGFGHAEVATAPALVRRIVDWLDAASASAASAASARTAGSVRMRR